MADTADQVRNYAPPAPPVEPDYYNGLARELVVLAMNRLGRGDDVKVRAFLDAARHILDLDRMVKVRK
jgi:hypothetical protein